MNKKNLLDLVPYVSEQLTWNIKESKNIEVVIRNKGVYNRIAQKILKKPVFSYIELDKYGSYIWLHIDGKHTVYEIAQMLHGKYEDEIEPLYERLAIYLKILSAHKFIRYS